jgi:hypothetical protein
MKLTIRLLVCSLVFALLILPTACGDAPAELPPASETPAPTATPEPTAEPAPPTAEPEPTKEPEPDFQVIEANLLGEKVSFNIGENAAIWQDVEAKSADGKITFRMAWGTALADVDGNPITELSATINENPAQPEFGKLLGPTVTFKPDATYIDSSVEIEFNYADYLDQLGEVPESDLYVAQYVVKNDSWAPAQMSQLNTTQKTVKVTIDRFYSDFTVGVMAKKKVVIEDAGAPENGINIEVDFVSVIKAGEPATITIKTVPGAHVVAWFIMPDTGTRSTRPADRVRVADADGKVTWEYELSYRTHKGEGRFEFYATTSEDPDFLKAFNAGRLDTIYPDKATDLRKFMNGEITTLEFDDKTTGRWYPLIVAVGG